jgi:hypothetical protein
MSTKTAKNNPESLVANDWLALMKITELKAELVLRQQNTNGNKDILVARIREVILMHSFL